MARVAISTALGGAVLFLWGFVYWAMMPYPRQVIHSFADEGKIVDAMAAQVRRDGAYAIPGMTSADPMRDDEADWAERHRQGPIAMVFYSSRGVKPMEPQVFILGMTMNLATAFIAALLLHLAGLRSYFARVSYVAALGVFAALASHLKQANWFYFPWDYTQLMLADQLLGTLVLGIVVAAIVKPAEPV